MYFILWEDIYLFGKSQMEFGSYISYKQNETFFTIDTVDSGFGICCYLYNVNLLWGTKSSWSCLVFKGGDLDLSYFRWIKWGKRKISTSRKGSLWYTILPRSDINISKYLQADWRSISLFPEWHYTITGSSLAQTSRFLQQTICLPGLLTRAPGLAVDLSVLSHAKPQKEFGCQGT